MFDEADTHGRIRVSVLLPPNTTERFWRLLEARRRLVAGEPLVRLSRHALALHALQRGLKELEAECRALEDKHAA